jgi:voltage-gated potassium channel
LIQRLKKIFHLISERRLFFAVGTITASIIIGTLGYMLIESWNFVDALYMTVITLSTVGFGEIHELSATGRIFTVIIIIINLSGFAYSFSILTSLINEGGLSKFWELLKNDENLLRMKNHVIVVGYGKTGKPIVESLIEDAQQVVVVEQNQDLVEELLKKGLPVISGDTTNDEILVKAGIELAKSIIITVSNEANAVYVTLTARQLKPDIYIVCTSFGEEVEKKFYKAGANEVVMLEKIGGFFVSSLLLNPSLSNFLKLISETGHNNFVFRQLSVNEIRNLEQNDVLSFRSKYGLNVIGIRKSDGNYIVNPSDQYQLEIEDEITVLGSEEQWKQIELINKKSL